MQNKSKLVFASFGYKNSLTKYLYFLEIIILNNKFFFANMNFRDTFDYVVIVFNQYAERIPLQFILAFYISATVGRWWTQFESITWPDDLVSAFERYCAI